MYICAFIYPHKNLSRATGQMKKMNSKRLSNLCKVIQTCKQPTYNSKPTVTESKVYPLSKTQCLQCDQHYKYWSRLLSNDQIMCVLPVHLLNFSLCLWQFNLLFQKVLIQPFLKWLVWIAATKKHFVPHPMSGDLKKNIRCFTHLT